MTSEERDQRIEELEAEVEEWKEKHEKALGGVRKLTVVISVGTLFILGVQTWLLSRQSTVLERQHYTETVSSAKGRVEQQWSPLDKLVACMNLEDRVGTDAHKTTVEYIARTSSAEELEQTLDEMWLFVVSKKESWCKTIHQPGSGAIIAVWWDDWTDSVRDLHSAYRKYK